jgi:integrase
MTRRVRESRQKKEPRIVRGRELSSPLHVIWRVRMHFPKPWFRPSRKTWYVEIDGKQHNLGADRDAAFRKYHELMTAPPSSPPPLPSSSVAAIFDRFLDWVEKHQAADTYRWYKDRLQSFLDHAPKGLLVGHLKPFHVQEWVDAMPHKNGTKRNYIRSVKRAMHWAEEQGYIDRSPIAHMKKPPQGKRDNVITPAEHRQILSLTKARQFRDLCDFCFLTGCRCAEALAVEARHLHLAKHRIIFPVGEEKMERAPRIIYLCDRAEEIVRPLAKAASPRQAIPEYPGTCLATRRHQLPVPDPCEEDRQEVLPNRLPAFDGNQALDRRRRCSHRFHSARPRGPRHAGKGLPAHQPRAQLLA